MLRHSSNSSSPFAKGIGAWFHDASYLAASLVVWNWRKSRYRRSRGNLRCPCQSLSDSGRPDESRCEASYYLKDPRRFALVCPALKQTAAGLRCHLPIAEVRPYWGRAIAITVVAVALLYGLGSTAVFTVLRSQGISNVQWIDCSWPPHWPNIAAARASHYQDLAHRALAEGDIYATIRALSRAVDLQPGNWRVALQLAGLYERIGQFAASEALFESLATTFPAQRTTIALAHHNAVVASQRFDSLEDLASDHVLRDQPNPTPTWLRALLFAVAESHRPSEIWTRKAVECDQLDPGSRALLALVAPPGQTDDPARVHAVMTASLTSPPVIALRWRTLLDVSLIEAARAALEQDAPSLSAFETALGHWLTLDPQTADFIVIAEWEDLVPLAPTVDEFNQLCAAVLTSSRRVPLAGLQARIPPGNLDAVASLWLVALLAGDPGLASELSPVSSAAGFTPPPEISADTVRANLPSLFDRFTIPPALQYALVRATDPAPPAPRF